MELELIVSKKKTKLKNNVVSLDGTPVATVRPDKNMLKAAKTLLKEVQEGKYKAIAVATVSTAGTISHRYNIQPYQARDTLIAVSRMQKELESICYD